MQQGEGIRVSSSAVAGGNITIDVGTADDVVEVGIAGSKDLTKYTVPASKSLSVPVPAADPGTVVVVRVGKGKRTRLFYVTIVAPTP
jgi:hypothetical protein